MDSTNSNVQIRKIVQGLFLLNALVWIILGIVSFWRTYSGANPQSAVYTIVSIMLFGNAAALLLSAWLVVKQDVWGYLFALAILAANIFFTFTDQVGWIDWATFGLDVVILLILLVKRRVFLPAVETG